MENCGTRLRPCPLCGSAPTHHQPTWPGLVAERGGAAYVTCGECDLTFANPLPWEGDLAAFHRHQYAEQQAPERMAKLDAERSRSRQYSPGFQKWARNLLTRMQAVAPSGGNTFLDVGCAAGGVLKVARDLGLTPTGVEVSPEAAKFGIREHHLDIRIGQLGDVDLPSASFGLILLHDVIEHVASPAEFLKECARLCLPGGVISVHTVNLASMTARVAGSDFYLADIGGGHVVLFTAAHLDRFLSDAGFTPFATETHGFRWVQREVDRENLGWKRPLVRLAENACHQWVKRSGRGHFIHALGRLEVAG